MKRHIEYIVFEVTPCKLGDLYRPLLPFFNQKDAQEFIKTYYLKYDFNFTCLQLFKVLV